MLPAGWPQFSASGNSGFQAAWQPILPRLLCPVVTGDANKPSVAVDLGVGDLGPIVQNTSLHFSKSPTQIDRHANKPEWLSIWALEIWGPLFRTHLSIFPNLPPKSTGTRTSQSGCRFGRWRFGDHCSERISPFFQISRPNRQAREQARLFSGPFVAVKWVVRRMS